ncbi:MAG: hypothetical protein ABIC40_00760 [bacterium]
MNRYFPIITVTILLSASIFGCSRSDSLPVSPDFTIKSPSQSTGVSNTQLWGYYDIYFDPIAGEAVAVPNRQMMFTANVVKFLNTKPPKLAVKINLSWAIPGEVIAFDVDVSITHPFPGLTEYNGYDVRGVFMGNGSESLSYNPDLHYSDCEIDQYLMGDPATGFGEPDGYTRWFNCPEFSKGGMPLFSYTPGSMAIQGYKPTATLCPYKYFADGLGATDDLFSWLDENPENHGVFGAGKTNTRNYVVVFPVPVGLKYGYAVIANWVGMEPEYHPSNAPESVAFKVEDNSTVYYIDPLTKGGDLILDISLFNWSTVQMESQNIFIESSVLSAPYQLSPDEMIPIGGDENFSTYHTEIPADNIQDDGTADCWVIAENPNGDYTNDFGVPNDAGTDTLAAFFRFHLDIYSEVYCPDVTMSEISGMEGNSGGFEQAKQGNSYSGVQITGSGFYGSSAIVELKKHDDLSVIVTADSVVIDSLTQITCDISIPSGQDIGLYDVYITNGCDVPKEGHGDNLVEIISATDIIPWDQGPNGEYYTEMSSTCGINALDLCVRQDDGGLYLIWTTSASQQAWASRHNPDFSLMIYETDVMQGPQGVYEMSEIEFGNTLIECNSSGTATALEILIGPYYAFEFNENLYMTGSLPNNPFPIIGWPGVPFGLAGITNTYEGNGAVASYSHLVLFGWSERYRWIARPGENDGIDYFNASSNTDPEWDFDGWLQGKAAAISIGNDQSAIWVLYTDVPHARRHLDLMAHEYATDPPTNFGPEGSGNGEITNPADMSIRLSDNRIYIMDKPGDELRIQAFDNETGDFVGTSGIIDLPETVTAYKMDCNDYDQLIYVLYSDNTIHVFKDTV